MINWEEIIKKAIMNGVLQAVMIFRPYVIPVLTSAVRNLHMFSLLYLENVEEWQEKNQIE